MTLDVPASRISYAVLAAAAVFAGPARAELPEAGRPFPVLTLPAMSDGSPLAVRSFRGRRVVLHVFASW